jgi:hypothetical protein
VFWYVDFLTHVIDLASFGSGFWSMLNVRMLELLLF